MMIPADLQQNSRKMESIGQLAGGMAHDFNNLLTVILSYSAMVIEDLGPDHPLRADMEEIRGAGQRGAALTRELLDFIRQSPPGPETILRDEIVRDSAANPPLPRG